MGDLTLYLVTPTFVEPLTGEAVIVLGREDAEAQSIALVASPDTTAVACEPITPGSTAEQDVITDAYFNGMDLGAPLLALAQSEGLDIDPENFDPYALLLTLRERAANAVCDGRR